MEGKKKWGGSSSTRQQRKRSLTRGGLSLVRENWREYKKPRLKEGIVSSGGGKQIGRITT